METKSELLKREKARNNLLKHINKAVREGKELDVSKIQDGGTYTRIRDKTTDRSTRKGIGIVNFPVISETYQAFKKAMDILGPGFEEYAEIYRDLHGEDNEENYNDTPDIENILKNFNEKGSLGFIPPSNNNKYNKFVGNEKTIYGILPDKTTRQTAKSAKSRKTTKNIQTDWREPSNESDSEIRENILDILRSSEEQERLNFMTDINQILKNPYSLEEKSSRKSSKKPSKKSTGQKKIKIYTREDVEDMEKELTEIPTTLDFLKPNKRKNSKLANRKIGFRDIKTTLKPRFTEYYED